jgi:hypothetical protein
MQYSNTTIFISRVYFCKKTTKESTSDTLSQIYVINNNKELFILYIVSGKAHKIVLLIGLSY